MCIGHPNRRSAHCFCFREPHRPVRSVLNCNGRQLCWKDAAMKGQAWGRLALKRRCMGRRRRGLPCHQQCSCTWLLSALQPRTSASTLRPNKRSPAASRAPGKRVSAEAQPSRLCSCPEVPRLQPNARLLPQQLPSLSRPPLPPPGQPTCPPISPPPVTLTPGKLNCGRNVVQDRWREQTRLPQWAVVARGGTASSPGGRTLRAVAVRSTCSGSRQSWQRSVACRPLLRRQPAF